ncbi:rhomboid family intramembrane serine protease [Nocardioides taihuensis]|uniref:Rhomboid family intramembrane serine protease n=1 Tax=Nocardioides taihuensis TaxID=1835606 RepID=A0ABW0BGB9_9ACTN
MTSGPTPEAGAETGVPTCYRHPGRESHIRCQRCERPICPECMRDAAVGFQCPDCVAQGAKQTRSGRTAYGGVRPGNPGFLTTVLIALNAGVWIAILATGGSSSRLVDYLGLRPRGVCLTDQGAFVVEQSRCVAAGAQWLPGVSDGAWWQLVTSAFTHVTIWHIFGNMLALWFLGPQLEQVFGRWRFLALYLLSAVAGSAVVYWLAPEYQLTLGASGAVFGLVGALLVIANKVKADVRNVLMWLVLMVVLSVAVPNISWEGHLGGFLGGAAAGAILVYAPRGPRRTTYQVVGLVVVAVVLLALIAARTAVLS